MAARKDFDPSRHGLTMEEWKALTPNERRRYTCRALYRHDRLVNPEKLTAKWRKRHGTQRSRERDRARYWADPEKQREKAREGYQRHHEKRLAYYHARRAKQESIANLRHDPDEMYRRVLAAVPAGLPRFARDDIAGMICLAVLEGKLLVANIEKEVGSFMRSYNREYDTFKTVSLDASVPGMEDTTYLDMLTSEEAT